MQHPFVNFLRQLPALHLPAREQARAAIGALLGIGLAASLGWLTVGNHPTLPWLATPMGAVAVLVFALPTSPVAQPWPVLGGNLVSALIGILCAQWIPAPVAAGTVAVALAILAMFVLRCLHPPGGAMALFTALAAPVLGFGFEFVLAPLGLNLAAMLLCAVLYNRLTGHRYPHVSSDHANTHRTQDPPPTDRFGITPEDLDAVLEEYDEVLDISRDELEDIIRKAEVRAHQRRFGRVTCADAMSTDVVKVEFGTDLKEAWRLLARHRLSALPVVNRFAHLIGMVEQQDFFRHLHPDETASLGQRMLRLLNGPQPENPEVVGQIMREQVVTVRARQSIAEVVPLFSDRGLRHAPVLDDQGKLVGMLSQSDVIAALYAAPGETPGRLAA